MRLKYLKVNDKVYSFNKNAIFILAAQNAGKTMLINLLQVIHGANIEKISKRNIAFKRFLAINPDAKFEWEFESGEKYLLYKNGKKFEVRGGNGELYTTAKYQERILSHHSFRHNVLGENLKTIESFTWIHETKQLLTPEKSGLFLAENKNVSYTAIKYLNLINLIHSDLEKFLIKIGQKKNIEAQKRKMTDNSIEKSFAIDINELLMIDDLEYSDIQRYANLQKMKKKDLNPTIVRELEKLVGQEKISKVIEFHNQLVDSYNDVIEKNRLEYEQTYEILKTVDKGSLRSSLKLREINDILQLEKVKVEGEIEKLSDKFNEQLEIIQQKFEDVYKFCSKNNMQTGNESIFQNKLLFQRDSLKISLEYEGDRAPGDGDNLMNFIYIIFYAFLKSEFPIMILDKSFLSELKEGKKTDVLENIIKQLPQNKLLFYLGHDDEEISEFVNNNHSVQGYIMGDEKIFGSIF